MTGQGRFEVAYRDVRYAIVGDEALSARIYRPVTTADQADLRFPAVLHVPGGGWTPSPIDHDPETHKLLACHGVVTVVAGVRHGEPHRHPAAALDVVRVARWLTDRARVLAIDVGRFVFVGTGAGAHAVTFAAVTPDGSGRSGLPTGLVLEAPAVDPGSALRGLPVSDVDSVMQYFGDAAGLRQAGLGELVYGGPSHPLPPLRLGIDADASMAPELVSDELALAWRRQGGVVARARVDTRDEVSVREHLLEAVLAMIGSAPPKRDGSPGREPSKSAGNQRG